MNEIIKILLSLSVSGTLLLLFILGLKQIYKNKCSRRWQYYIWLIAALRFLLPFTPDAVNVSSLFEKLPAPAVTNENPAGPVVPVAINPTGNEKKPQQVPADEDILAGAADYRPLNAEVCVFFVWSITALALFVHKITIYQEFIRYIKSGSTEVSDVKILNLLSDCEEKLKVRTRAELYQNPLISSPVIIGFFQPGIILPVRELEDNELSWIFMHELRHYKQRDMFYKWLIQIVACIHWFNPFVYLLEKEVNKACELSCDEGVISILNDSERRGYGDTLISFLKSDNFYKGSLASITLTEGAEQLIERLGAIMNFRKKTKAIQILTVLLTLCIMFGAVLVPVYPASAAVGSGSGKTSESSLSKKNYGTGTYIYDDNFDFSSYLNDQDWDVDWEDEDFDWEDEGWEFDWDWLDKELLDAYADYGIEYDGKSYYYQGKLVKMIQDLRPDGSSYIFGLDTKGTECIKVIHNAKDEITDVSVMTEEEAAEMSAKLLGQKAVGIPVINTKEWDSSTLLTVEAYYKSDSISILPSPGNKIILKEYLTENKSAYYAHTKMKNNVLTIRGGDRPETNYQSYIEIYVPDNVLEHIKVETESGTITADNYTGVLELSAASGGIDIFGSHIAGSIRTVSGEIELFPSGITGDLSVTSQSGNIETVFPESYSYNLKAKTDTGTMKSSYFDIKPKNKKEFSGIVGSNPKFTITLETVSGSMEID